MSFKKLLASGTILAAVVASSAFAADLPSRKYAPVAPVAPIFTWTGFYVGVNAGATWNHGTKRVTPPVAGWFNGINTNGGWRKSDDNFNFTGGAQVGYNYQIGNFVVGAEADFNYANVESTLDGAGRAVAGPIVVDDRFTAKSKVEWFSTLRARLGFTPMERLMVYGTGGLAYGSVKASAAETSALSFNGVNLGTDVWYGSKNDNRVGWTLGAGAEYALTNNLSLKAEYLYVDLGKQRFSTVYGGPVAAFVGTPAVRVERDTKFSVVRAGVNYRF